MFLRKTLPLLICFFCGVFAIIGFFSAEGTTINTYYEKLAKWNSIIAAFAMLLGVGNLLRVNFVKISRNHQDKVYCAILIVSLIATASFGLIGGVYSSKPVYYMAPGQNFDLSTIAVTYKNENRKIEPMKIESWSADTGSVSLNTYTPPTSDFNGVVVLWADYMNKNEAKKIKVELHVRKRPAYEGFLDFFKNKCAYVFEYMIKPMQSTMFSLLAFFVASAAFRAFRAKSFEATILLVTAFIVMLGRVPIGTSIWPGFAGISEWILSTVNMAGSRAITLGAAVGATAACLKIILGLETRYLGGE